MKKYLVIKKIAEYSASEEREFDNIDDARMYKNLCAMSEQKNYIKYYVCEVLE